MAIKTIGFGPSLQVHWGSDIERLEWDSGVLSIVVAREIANNDEIHGFDIRFSGVSGLRFLDELDLARYWSSDGFVRGHHVLEVLDDGWASEEIALQGYEQARREWLVVTGNGCASVFAAAPPEIAETSWCVAK